MEFEIKLLQELERQKLKQDILDNLTKQLEQMSNMELIEFAKVHLK